MLRNILEFDSKSSWNFLPRSKFLNFLPQISNVLGHMMWEKADLLEKYDFLRLDHHNFCFRTHSRTFSVTRAAYLCWRSTTRSQKFLWSSSAKRPLSSSMPPLFGKSHHQPSSSSPATRVASFSRVITILRVYFSNPHSHLIWDIKCLIKRSTKKFHSLRDLQNALLSELLKIHICPKGTISDL